jgi:predicted enzyme related to lactoylglutathione lyase
MSNPSLDHRLISRPRRISICDMTPTAPRPLVHIELHTPDGAAARAFYSELLGWRPELIEAAERSYLALDLGEGPSGGIVECGTERALWLPYVSVPDIVVATRRARELGAEIVLEPREGPAGWRSVISVPGAGEIALWQSKSWQPGGADPYVASAANR